MIPSRCISIKKTDKEKIFRGVRFQKCGEYLCCEILNVAEDIDFLSTGDIVMMTPWGKMKNSEDIQLVSVIDIYLKVPDSWMPNRDKS